jgi:hypothetical protein
MGKHLDEGVLNRLVGLGGVAKVLIRDARRAPLMQRHELAKPFARLVHVAALDEPADFDGDAAVVGNGRVGRPLGRRHTRSAMGI